MKQMSKFYTIYMHPLVVLLLYVVTSGVYLFSFYRWGTNIHQDMVPHINDFLHNYLVAFGYKGLLAFMAYYVYWIMRMYHMKYEKAFGVLAVFVAGFFMLQLLADHPAPYSGASTNMLFLIVIVSARIVAPFWDIVLSFRAFVQGECKYDVDPMEWVTWLLPSAAYVASLLLFYGLDILFGSHYMYHLFLEDYAFFLNFMVSCLIVYTIKRKAYMRVLVNVLLFVLVNMIMVYMYYTQAQDIVVSVYLYAHKLVFLIMLIVILDLFANKEEQSLNWLAKHS